MAEPNSSALLSRSGLCWASFSAFEQLRAMTCLHKAITPQCVSFCGDLFLSGVIRRTEGYEREIGKIKGGNLLLYLTDIIRKIGESDCPS